MKKLLILPLIAMPLVACNAETEQTPLEIIQNIVANAPADAYVVNNRENNKIILKVAVTPELQKIYAQEKNSQFMADDFVPFIESGYCFITDDIKYNTYRVFCGTQEDISEDNWSVSINKEVTE